MPEGKIEQILNKKEEKPQENIVNKPQQMEEKTETKEIKPQKFTFLIQEQICGDNSLDIFRKRGKEAAITDFSILLGGYAYVKGEWSLEGRTGWYWTKSDNGANDARVVSVNGTSFYSRVNERDGGARPALMLSSIDRIPTNGESGKKTRNEMLEVEYGYYPQKAVSRDMQERLERAYLSRKHIKNKK